MTDDTLTCIKCGKPMKFIRIEHDEYGHDINVWKCDHCKKLHDKTNKFYQVTMI